VYKEVCSHMTSMIFVSSAMGLLSTCFRYQMKRISNFYEMGYQGGFLSAG